MAIRFPRGIRRLLRLPLRRRRDVELETDDEIRFHIAARIDRLMARGLSRDAAEAEAWRLFGPPHESRAALVAAAQQREETLGMLERLDTIRGDALYALRQLRRAPLFTVTVVASLAVGIGVNATMFGIIDRLLLRPPPGIVGPEGILSLGQMQSWNGEEYRSTGFSYAKYKDYRDRLSAFSIVGTASNPRDMGLGRGAAAKKIRGMIVSETYLRLTGAAAQIGRFFLPEEDREPDGVPVAVVSHGFWQRELGGRSDAIGTTLDINAQRYTIVGVAPAGFTGLQRAPVDVFLPIVPANTLRRLVPDWTNSRNHFWLETYARLKPGVTQAQAEAEASAMLRGLALAGLERDSTPRVALKSIMPRADKTPTSAVRISRLLAAVSFLVLLIACANVANLQVARAVQRRREIAVRLALGIGRARLMAQLMTESVILALLAGAAGLVVVRWGGALVRSLLLPDYSWESAGVDWRMLSFTTSVAVAAGLLCGLLPALHSSREDVTQSLKEGSREGSVRRSRTRTVLLFAQAALAVVLLIGAGLFVRSLRNINAVELGIETNKLLVAWTDLSAAGYKRADEQAVFAKMEARMKAMPGIARVSVGGALPFSTSYATYIRIPGHDTLPSFADGGPYVNAVTPDFFPTLGIPILRGRGFMDADRASHARVMVVSESMARLIWKGDDPIGQCVKFDADSLPCTRIVGIAGNTHRQTVVEKNEIVQYWVQLEHAPAFMRSRILYIRPADGDVDRWVEPVRRELQTTVPNLPYADVRPMRNLYAREVRDWKLGATMFGLFGLVALALTAVGLYSVIAYGVVQRRLEMGVRIALGAQRGDILQLVTAQGVRVALVGVIVGVGIAVAAGRFVAELLYGVTPKDPPTMIGVAVVLLTVALMASLIPAWRATRVDPVVALRSD